MAVRDIKIRPATKIYKEIKKLNLLKIILFCFVHFFSMPVSFANQTRFYTGLGFGGDFVNYKLSDVRFASPPFDLIQLGNRGWSANIFGGVGITFNNLFYLGAEIFASHSDNDVTDGPASLEENQSFGIGVMPGVKLNPLTLLYGKLAWLQTNFSFSNAHELDFNKNERTARVGIGIEYQFLPQLNFRVEYDHDRYKQFQIIENVKIKPSSDEVYFSVSYNFFDSNGPCQANSLNTPQSHFIRNIYIGGSVGIDFSYYGINGINPLTSVTKVDMGGTGFLKGIYGGVGSVIANHFYLGLEPFYFSNDSKTHIGPTQLEQSNTKGISAITGIMFSQAQAMFYLREGWVKTDFSLNGASILDFKQSVNGVRLGAGIDIPIFRCLTGRLEYDHDIYQNINANNIVLKTGGNSAHLDISYHMNV